MATQKEVLQEQQNQLRDDMDFYHEMLEKSKDAPQFIIDMINQKMDELLDKFNELQRKIDEL